MNYNKIIEAMAKAMYENEYEHDWKWSGSLKEKFIQAAKAALEALQGELPDYTVLKYGSRMLESERELLGNSVLYNELKNLKEEE